MIPRLWYRIRLPEDIGAIAPTTSSAVGEVTGGLRRGCPPPPARCPPIHVGGFVEMHRQPTRTDLAATDGMSQASRDCRSCVNRPLWAARSRPGPRTEGPSGR